MNKIYQNCLSRLITSHQKLNAIKTVCNLEKSNMSVLESFSKNNLALYGILKNNDPRYKMLKILAKLRPIYAKIIQNDFIDNSDKN
ncbi:UNVERIFIED_CONTAM: hypothetical protein O8I53_06110 [Campylobacter lari]